MNTSNSSANGGGFAHVIFLLLPQSDDGRFVRA
jgi:hypothetical protein